MTVGDDRIEIARNDPKKDRHWIRVVGGRLAGCGAGDPPRDLPWVDARTGKRLSMDSGRPADGSKE